MGSVLNTAWAAFLPLRGTDAKKQGLGYFPACFQQGDGARDPFPTEPAWHGMVVGVDNFAFSWDPRVTEGSKPESLSFTYFSIKHH